MQFQFALIDKQFPEVQKALEATKKRLAEMDAKEKVEKK
jgi:hypothetical protein